MTSNMGLVQNGFFRISFDFCQVDPEEKDEQEIEDNDHQTCTDTELSDG